jgi:hypothetical protein
MRSRSMRSGRALSGAAVAILVAALVAGGVYLSQTSSAGTGAETLIDAGATTTGATIPKAELICGQAILRSPFNYTGNAGNYKSGKRGLPTYGKTGTNFPNATNGVVLPSGTHSLQNWQLRKNTVYYLLPGVHVGNIQADTGDAFVGGYSKGQETVLTGNYAMPTAIDSNTTYGNQSGVTIEYLTIEKYHPYGNQGAVNQ